MKKHLTNTRDHLGELSTLAAQTHASERNILRSAERRLDVVNAAIERSRPGAETAPRAAQERYLDLVQERGQLRLIIARAQGYIAGY